MLNTSDSNRENRMISELQRQQLNALSAISYRTREIGKLSRQVARRNCHSTRKLAVLEKQIEDHERGRDVFVKFLASTDVAMLKLPAAAPLDLLDEIGRTGLLPLSELFDRAKRGIVPHEYLALAIAGRLAGEHAARLSDASNGEDPDIELLVDFEGAVFDQFQAIFSDAIGQQNR
jgi:hypothetical protein